MNRTIALPAALLLSALVSCQQTSIPDAEPTGTVSPRMERIAKPSGEGWNEIVPGYWVKTEEYMGGPLVTTYIDNSSRQALEYERAQYVQAVAQLKADGLHPQTNEGDYYLGYLNDAIKNVGKVGQSIDPLYTCTTNPVFSVGGYNNGSRSGVISHVAGSCSNGGRASAIAKYDGITSNIYDADGTQTRTYSATAEATRYTLTPAANATYDCAEARMGSTTSTVKRHWGKTNDCIYYN